jgi:phage protein D
MTTAVKLHEQPQTFYVPEFAVKVGGRDLPEQVIHDVVEVKYTDSIEKIDSFELTLSNWDDMERKPKYEPPSVPAFQRLFDPGQTVELQMGYAGDQRLMLTGEITTLEPSYRESGPLTLTVRGLNELHRFRAAQHTYSWENKRDSDIAREIGQKPISRDKPGLGIEVKTKPRADEPTEPYVFMDGMFDIVFLLNRARKRGYELVLKVEKSGGSVTRHLYFGPSANLAEAPPAYVLEWGRSMIRFQPTLSTATQISEVTVRGWDRRSNRKIEETVKLLDVVPRSERARYEQLIEAFGDRKEIITDRPVHTKQQAKAIARERLLDKSKQMVTASGATIGLSDLRSGRYVDILGLGERFNGRYYLTETTHTIGSIGYQTEFKARREDQAAQRGGAQ